MMDDGRTRQDDKETVFSFLNDFQYLLEFKDYRYVPKILFITLQGGIFSRKYRDLWGHVTGIMKT